MKVVIVNQHINEALGGSEIQCDLIAKGLLRRGHSVTYVAPCLNSNLFSECEYSVKAVSKDPISIVESVLEEGPDVVYWRYNKHNFLKIAKRLHAVGIPMVFASSHINDVTFLSFKGTIASVLRRAINHFGMKYVTALTVNNLDFLGKAPVKKQKFIPNAMLGSSINFDWPRPYIAWIANIKAAKRPEIAISLAKAISSMGIDVLMIGKIQSDDYAWMKKREIFPQNCFYLGAKSVAEVNGVLKSSLFHIHTCLPEGFSNVFIQAWLQGKPSISYSFDPCSYIKEKNLGYVCEGRFDDFVEKVKFLISSESDRMKFGTNAKFFSKSAFDLERLIDQVEDVLSEAANSKAN